MGQPNGGRNFVDVLATVAAGAGGSDLDVIHVERDILGINLGKNDDSGSGGLNPAMFFGDGDALDTVGTGFPFELVIGIKTGDFDNVVVYLSDFPAHLVGIADVHVEKVSGL